MAVLALSLGISRRPLSMVLDCRAAKKQLVRVWYKWSPVAGQVIATRVSVKYSYLRAPTVFVACVSNARTRDDRFNFASTAAAAIWQ